MEGSVFDRRSEEQSEVERHDRLYTDLAAGKGLVMDPSAWDRFDKEPDAWQPYESFVRLVGDVRHKRLLDAGCGDGWLSVIMAKRGARVDGFDISPAAIRIAAERAVANDVGGRCTFQTASAYELPYPAGSFDAVIGSALLHHLGDKGRFASELRRVMKPGAVAVFQEPFGNSLLLERLRRLVPVPSVAPDDPDQWKQQFKYRDIEALESEFLVVAQEYHLLSRLDRVIRWDAVVAMLGKLDRFLLRALPFLRPYARIMVLQLRPRAS